MKVNSRIKLRLEVIAMSNDIPDLPPDIYNQIGVVLKIQTEIPSLGRVVPYPYKCIFKHNDVIIFEGWFSEKELIPINNKENYINV